MKYLLSLAALTLPICAQADDLFSVKSITFNEDTRLGANPYDDALSLGSYAEADRLVTRRFFFAGEVEKFCDLKPYNYVPALSEVIIPKGRKLDLYFYQDGSIRLIGNGSSGAVFLCQNNGRKLYPNQITPEELEKLFNVTVERKAKNPEFKRYNIKFENLDRKENKEPVEI